MSKYGVISGSYFPVFSLNGPENNSTFGNFSCAALYCFQSPWFQCIIIESGIFPWWVVSKSLGGGFFFFFLGGGVHVYKERGDIKKGLDEKGYMFPHYDWSWWYYLWIMIMIHFATWLKEFNIMLHLQLLVQLNNLLSWKFTKSLVLNP